MKMSYQEAVNEIADTIARKPTFVVLVGVPGVGKSTFIQRVHDHPNVVIYDVASTDNLVEREAVRLGLTYTEAFGKVNFKHLQHEFRENIRCGVAARRSIIVDRTNMSKKSRRSVLSLVGGDARKEYTLYCVNFDLPHDVVRERLDVRAVATGKVIGPAILGSMYKNYETPTKDEGFDRVIEVL